MNFTIKNISLYHSCSLFLFFLMFLLFFYVTRYTPFHSDDYSFYLLGLSLESQFKFYLNWSGRVLANYGSTLLVLPKNLIFAAFLKSLLASLTVLLIIKIGFINSTKSRDNFFVTNILYATIFIIFFNFHPTIGQVILWNVGAGHYLLTSFFSILFIYLLVSLSNTSSKWLYYICLFVALPAGLSNEFMSVFITFFFVYYFIFNKKINKTKLIPIGFLLAIGVSLLVFSPGNSARLHCGAFDSYLSRSIIEKFIYFVSHDLRTVISVLKLPIFLGIVLIGINFTRSREIDKRALIFYCFGWTVIFLFFLSPYVVIRTLYVPFIILMLSISCSFATLLKQNVINSRCMSKPFFLILSLFFVIVALFIQHYISLATSVKSTYYQQQFRDKLVKMNLKDVEIPNYYWLKEFKSGDHIDYFFSPGSYAKFLDVNSKIKQKNINFDYGVLIKGRRTIANNKTGDQISIYSKRQRLVNLSSLVIELNDSVLLNDFSSLILIDDTGLAISYYLTENNYYHDVSMKKLYIGLTSSLPRTCFVRVMINDELYTLKQKVCL